MKCIEDTWGTVPHGTRQYRILRAEEWQVTGFAGETHVALYGFRRHGGWVGPEVFGGLTIDFAPHRAFVTGFLPAPVYADWLEENGVEMPPEALALLRCPIGQEV